MKTLPGAFITFQNWIIFYTTRLKASAFLTLEEEQNSNIVSKENEKTQIRKTPEKCLHGKCG